MKKQLITKISSALLIVILAIAALPIQTTQARPLNVITAINNNIGTNTTKTAGTTLVITTTATVAAGDDIIVTFAMDEVGGTVSVADSAGNIYTSFIDISNNNDVRTRVFAAFHVIALPSGSTITITHPNVASRAAIASNFRGLAAAGAFDRSSTNQGTSTNPTSNSTATTTQAGELLIGAIGINGASTDTAGTWQNTFTAGPRVGTVGTGTNTTLNMGYRIVNATAAYTAQVNGTVNTSYAASIATFRMDVTAPTVTINQAAGQSDPTGASPINFTVIFSERVTGFATGDVSFTGSTAGGTLAGVITEIAPNNGTTYSVAVTGMTSSGTVVATIAAGSATDIAGNSNTVSTNTDNVVTFNANTAPTNIILSASSIAENNTLNAVIGALSTTDPDAGNTFTYSLVNGGLACPGTDNASFNIGGGNLQASSTFDYETKNSYIVCVRTADQGALTFDKQFTISVTNVNEAPVVTDIPDQIIAEGGAFATINLDNFVSDVDNTDNQMTWTYTGNAALTVSINAARVATISILSADWNGSEAITFTATDPGLLFNGNAATFNVTAVNDAPVCNNVTITTNEDTTGITAPNCIDVDGNTLIYSVVSAASNGTGSFAASNLSYAPNSNFNGSDNFTYKANDGTADSNIANIGVTVTAVNDAPTFTKGTDQTVNENAGAQTVNGWATAINDGDPELTQTLTFSVTGNTNPGLFSVTPAINAATGNLTYTPAANANGSATITLTLSDNGSGTPPNVNTSVSQTFVINVTAVNNAPTFTKGADQTVNEDAGAQTVNGWATAINDGDPELTQTLTFNVTGNTNPGLFSVAPAINGATGNLTYTPAANANGSATITLTLSDNGSGTPPNVNTSAPQAFVINVTAVNDAPVCNNVTITTNEDTTGSTAPNCIDVDGNTLIYSVVGAASNGTGSFATPNLSYAPNSNFNGLDNFTYKANDGTADSNVANVGVTVTAVNDAPTFTKGADQTVNENAGAQTVNGWATAINDGDPELTQTLTFNITGNTNPGLFSVTPTINSATGNLTYTPAANANGNATITLTLSDNGSGTPPNVNTSASQTFVINVTAVNNAPTFTKGADQTVNEDAGVQTVNGWATAINDGDPELTQTLTFNVTGNTNPGLFSVAPAINATTGNFTYTPAANANGSATITLTLSDNGSGTAPNVNTSAAQTFVINVTAVNDAPVCNNVTITTNEDTTGTTAPNCIDVDGNTLIYSVVSAASSGTGSFAASNLSYAPNSNFNGPDSFTYKANDGTADSNIANVGVTVTAVNDAPVCNNVTITTNEDTTGITAPNCSDVDGDSLTYSVVGVASNGIGSFATSNLSYAPNSNFNGSDSFTYIANDGTTDSNIANVGITVTAINDAPVCSGVTIGTSENTTGSTLPVCSDVDGNPLTFSVVGAASNGTGSFASPNLSYAPNLNFNGLDSFTYKANDGTADSNIANVGVTINAVNNAPTFTKGADQTVNEDAGAQTVNGWATAISAGPADEFGQTLTFNVTGNTNPGLFSAGPGIDATTGDLTYTPAANANGSATITLTLIDNGGTANGGADTSPAQTFAINVNPVNDPPSFTSSPVTSATQGTLYTYNITVTDPDGDPLTISASTQPAWLSFTDNGDGTATLSGTPGNGDVGSHNVVLRVSDGVVAVPVEQAFTVVVDNVNDAPTFTSVPVVSVGESTPYTYNVVTDDLDAGDTLTISATTLPSWLTLVDNGPRKATLSGTPSSSQVGLHNVALEVTDGTLTTLQEFVIDVGNSAPQVATNGITTLADTGDGVLAESEHVSVGVTQLLVKFNQDVYNPANDNDGHDVTNPANYLLVRDNGDGFQTTSCLLGVDALDTAITVDSVVYSNGGGTGPFVSTLNINSGFPLSNGNYRLYVCGTTSIVDIVDNALELAGDGTTPGTDFIRNFIVTIGNNNGGENGGGRKSGSTSASFSTSGLLIPVTGFAPDRVTLLPAQPANKAYKPMKEIRIEIPSLGIDFPIVGAAVSMNSWDLTWLKNSVAYLEGSAYPTLSGNTVLTGHVTDANNNLGPFSDIKGLKLGDKIYLHAYGRKFVYQVQENSKVLPANISAVFKHEEYNWVTLVTCEEYNATTAIYQYRRLVRAVLISVLPEK